MSALRVAEGHNVILHHPETGNRHLFESGDALHEWAAQAITNPEVVDGDLSTVPLPPGVVPGAAGTGRGASAPTPEPPPRSGAGSGDKAWRAYAEAIGIVVPEKAKKAEIIALVDANVTQHPLDPDTGDSEGQGDDGDSDDDATGPDEG